MADGVTTLGGGWDQVPPNTAEALLRDLIAGGSLTGEEIIQALKGAGWSDRGPAYYAKQGDKGPFYALGNPHDYAALDVVNGVPQWDLMNFDPSTTVIHNPPPPPPPPPTTDPRLDTILAKLDALAAQSDANTAKIQKQIDDVVARAETTLRQLVPIAEALLPALSGLIPPRQ